jgi:IS30 family transposase
MGAPARIQQEDVVAMRRAGIACREIARQLQVSRSYVSQCVRRAARQEDYSAAGDPIGWDQKDLIERDRSRIAVTRELALLRERATQAAYG